MNPVYNTKNQEQQPPPPYMTVGDLDHPNQYPKEPPPSSNNRTQAPKPLIEIATKFVRNLHHQSPTLSILSLLSVLVFLLWQIPSGPASPLLRFLQTHFVCSRDGVIRKKRIHTMLLSSISHIGFFHVLFNLYSFVHLGAPLARFLEQVLDGNGYGLWWFVIGASISGSMMHILTSFRGEHCMGLSDVTLAMFAFEAKRNPSREFRTIYFPGVGFLAQHVLTVLLVVSAFGVLIGGKNNSGGGVAHAAHLGGLLFGVGYYEAMLRGWIGRGNRQQQQRRRWAGYYDVRRRMRIN